MQHGHTAQHGKRMEEQAAKSSTCLNTSQYNQIETSQPINLFFRKRIVSISLLGWLFCFCSRCFRCCYCHLFFFLFFFFNFRIWCRTTQGMVGDDDVHDNKQFTYFYQFTSYSQSTETAAKHQQNKNTEHKVCICAFGGCFYSWNGYSLLSVTTKWLLILFFLDYYLHSVRCSLLLFFCSLFLFLLMGKNTLSLIMYY